MGSSFAVLYKHDPQSCVSGQDLQAQSNEGALLHALALSEFADWVFGM